MLPGRRVRDSLTIYLPCELALIIVAQKFLDTAIIC